MMLIIGESINGTIPKVGEAILNRDETFLKELAKSQHKCGAHYLDVNAGVASGNEVKDLPWLVNLVQQEVPIPLMLDSANPEALTQALAVYRHSDPPILNSISGEKAKWDYLFPLVIEKQCKVVVLLMDDQGIPKSIEEKLGIAQRLYEPLVNAGLPPDHIFFDILVLSIAVEPDAARVALQTIQTIHAHFPAAHLICGVSNVSMGLPGRRLINRTFLMMAIAFGLDTLLVDVRDQALMSSIYAAKALMNEDPYCLEYLQAYREKKLIL